MDLLDWNGFDRFGSLCVNYGREYRVENNKGEKNSSHYRFTHRFSQRTAN
jgi:hypothetical protein